MLLSLKLWVPQTYIRSAQADPKPAHPLPRRIELSIQQETDTLITYLLLLTQPHTRSHSLLTLHPPDSPPPTPPPARPHPYDRAPGGATTSSDTVPPPHYPHLTHPPLWIPRLPYSLPPTDDPTCLNLPSYGGRLRLLPQHPQADDHHPSYDFGPAPHLTGAHPTSRTTRS
ncbi:unnamed protein product [Dicrocoelium dendriticum]|nr:unnamed protein product [Dicrocoelium dendriticum]